MKLIEQVKTYPFIAMNTIRDIRYMNSLIEKNTSQVSGIAGISSPSTKETDRIHKEMEVTMPAANEIKIFLTDPIVRSSFESREKSGISPSILIKYLDIEKQIQIINESNLPETEKTLTIEKIRKLLQELPITPVKNPENTESTGGDVPVVKPIKKTIKVI